MPVDAAWATVIIAGAVAVCTGGAWFGRRMWHLLAGTTRFLDEYFGTDPHAGDPGRPGVTARLAELEEHMRTLIAETRPNGGTSLRDIVNRTASDVMQIKEEQGNQRAQLEALRTRGQAT